MGRGGTFHCSQASVPSERVETKSSAEDWEGRHRLPNFKICCWVHTPSGRWSKTPRRQTTEVLSSLTDHMGNSKRSWILDKARTPVPWAFCQVSNFEQLTCRTPLSLSVPSPSVHDPLAVSLLNYKVRIIVTTSCFPTGMTPLRKCTKLKPSAVHSGCHNCNQGVFTLFAIRKEK